MHREDIISQNGRTNRFMNPAKPQSFEANSQDKKTTCKRRVSCDQSKTVKRTNQTDNAPWKKADPYNFNNYKISTDVISFEMEEQRSIQMKTITSDEKLEAYYLSFKKLFTILYQASHIIDENIFKLHPNLFKNKSIGFLCLIFEQPKDKRDCEFLANMKPLAKNVLFLANNPNEFQRRIDLVARKVTLQNDKRQKIKNAFLNPKIQRTWEQTVQKCFSDQQIETFVEDQFDTPEEKFCFIEIKDFIINKLSTEAFGNDLRKYCVLQELNDDLSLDFKFQFLLAEQFSFTVPVCLVKDIVKPVSASPQTAEDNKCSIM